MFLHPFSRTFRLYSTSASAVQTTLTILNPKEWDISVALALFRMPIKAPPLTEIEEKFKKIAELIEHEQSYKSNFELETEKDLK